MYNAYKYEKLTKKELIDIIKDCCMADQHDRIDSALKTLLNNEDITFKLIKLNEVIDTLIDVAHDTYICCTDEKEKARLDGQVKAYWEIKNHIENILEIN